MTVAADPRIYPMGTKLYIAFYSEKYKSFSGIYTVRDRGGSIKGKRIDLFMGDFRRYSPHPSCYDFGVKKARVYLLK